MSVRYEWAAISVKEQDSVKSCCNRLEELGFEIFQIIPGWSDDDGSYYLQVVARKPMEIENKP